MLRCKKGDLAIVIKGVYSGSIVDVLEYVGTKTGITHDGKIEVAQNCWRVSSPREQIGFHDVLLGEFFAEDHHLLPIRPGDLKETDVAEKEVESV